MSTRTEKCLFILPTIIHSTTDNIKYIVNINLFQYSVSTSFLSPEWHSNDKTREGDINCGHFQQHLTLDLYWTTSQLATIRAETAIHSQPYEIEDIIILLSETGRRLSAIIYNYICLSSFKYKTVANTNIYQYNK